MEIVQNLSIHQINESNCSLQIIFISDTCRVETRAISMAAQAIRLTEVAGSGDAATRDDKVGHALV